jgi:NhaP-type Na+/H+ or K+/H+ antiporter
MTFAIWSLIVGLLLIAMALGGTVLKRLPLSTSMLYLAVGIAVSPAAFGLLWFEPMSRPVLLEHMTELAVLVSLFVAGMKLSLSLKARRWRLPLRLATTSMALTVLAITVIGYWGLGLPVGAAILLGAILAPTDPVLASDVQVHHPGDRDKLHFALTGEGGLNDGTAFPFVMLGLGLLGLHEIGEGGWRWLAVDVVWATAAGLGTGALLGSAVGRLTLFLRRKHKEAVGTDDFIAIGLIGLAYGAALLVHGYGFLAVFAAGVALRQFVQSQGGGSPRTVDAVQRAMCDPDQSLPDAVAADQENAPSFMAQAVLGFTQQLERVGEVTVVIVIGALLWSVQWQYANWWFVVLLLVVIRPVAVAVGLTGSPVSPTQRRLIGWFGIRGIGSIYYLMYAINHGLPEALAQQLMALTLSVVVTSVVVHGVSVTPLMTLYERRVSRKAG